MNSRVTQLLKNILISKISLFEVAGGSQCTRPMDINNTLTSLETELTFPIDQDSVIERIGAMEIEAPDAEETQTVATIISSVGQETYASADELFATILGNVNDKYIGRKFYDDRGGNPSDMAFGPTDEDDVSF